MSHIVDICQADDPRDVVHQAVQLLAQGKSVVFPMETSYVVAAYAPSELAVKQLATVVEQATSMESFLFTLVFRCGAEALDYFPKVSQLGHRLLRKKLPGSLTIGFDEHFAGAIFLELPSKTREILSQQNSIWIRFPVHHIISAVASLLPGPLVLLQQNGSNQHPSKDTFTNLEELTTSLQLCEDSCLAIVDSENPFFETSTLLQIDNETWDIVSPGSIDNEKLRHMTSENYLFVCTGNTCRSPMAEGLFRQKLATLLNCQPEELASKGFNTSSAGLAAMYGSPAAAESVQIVEAHQGELNEHRSQPLTDQLLDESDWIFTMTRNHRDTILAVCPDAADRVHLLSANEGDISDPIGGGMSAYKRSEDEILSGIEQILKQISDRQK